MIHKQRQFAINPVSKNVKSWIILYINIDSQSFGMSKLLTEAWSSALPNSSANVEMMLACKACELKLGAVYHSKQGKTLCGCL